MEQVESGHAVETMPLFDQHPIQKGLKMKNKKIKQVHKTKEEKSKKIEELESVINDPEKCRMIAKIFKWILPEGKAVFASLPNSIHERGKSYLLKKRRKAELLEELTEEQRSKIKEVLVLSDLIVN